MLTKRKLTGILLALVLFLVVCVGIQTVLISAGGLDRKQISSCSTIDEPGRYELTSEITNGGGTRISQSCIEIRSGNVILDGNGHVIDGRGTSHTIGVAVRTSENSSNKEVRIENVTVTDWHKGVAFHSAAQGRVQDVSASGNVYGIHIENTRFVLTMNYSSNNNIVDSKASRGSIHIQL